MLKNLYCASRSGDSFFGFSACAVHLEWYLGFELSVTEYLHQIGTVYQAIYIEDIWCKFR